MSNVFVRACGNQLVFLENCEMEGEVSSQCFIIAPYADKSSHEDEDRADNKGRRDFQLQRGWLESCRRWIGVPCKEGYNLRNTQGGEIGREDEIYLACINDMHSQLIERYHENKVHKKIKVVPLELGSTTKANVREHLLSYGPI